MKLQVLTVATAIRPQRAGKCRPMSKSRCRHWTSTRTERRRPSSVYSAPSPSTRPKWPLDASSACRRWRVSVAATALEGRLRPRSTVAAGRLERRPDRGQKHAAGRRHYMAGGSSNTGGICNSPVHPSVLPSFRPSVLPSFRPSVRPSVLGPICWS